MAMKKSSSRPTEQPERIFLNGQHLDVLHHKTDFSVMTHSAKLGELGAERIGPIAANLTRVSTSSASKRNSIMSEIRTKNVALNVYVLEDVKKEIVFDDKVILELSREDTGELERAVDKFSLEYTRRMGSAHILRTTSATCMNPVKVSLKISAREEVMVCSPQLILDIQFHSQPQASHPNFHYIDLWPHITDRDGVNELYLSDSAFGDVAKQFYYKKPTPEGPVLLTP